MTKRKEQTYKNKFSQIIYCQNNISNIFLKYNKLNFLQFSKHSSISRRESLLLSKDSISSSKSHFESIKSFRVNRFRECNDKRHVEL